MKLKIIKTFFLIASLIFSQLSIAAIRKRTVEDNYNQMLLDLPFSSFTIKTPTIPELTVSLKEFGGKGDGITLNTDAITNAISFLSEKGGGHLILDEGVWLSGPIILKDNIDLHITKNAILLFSPDKSLFPIIDADQGTSGAMRQPPIFCHNITNFSITGKGVIDGNGEVWRPIKRFKVSDAEWKNLQHFNLKEGKEGNSDVFWPTVGNPTEKIENKRARLIRITGCKNFIIKDIVVQNSPSFHINTVLSHDFIIDNVTVRCPWNAQNGDGIDLSSCKNVLITGSSIDAGDDAICLKSGIGDSGRERGPCENIVIKECTVFHGHGGFVIGSDTSGGMHNIYVGNCRFLDTDIGLRFKSGRDRGGLMTGIYVDNIVMCDISNEAILFDSYYEEKVGDGKNALPAPVSNNTPIFKGFYISKIICRDAGRAIVMKGLPESNISDVIISDCKFTSKVGIILNHASDITIRDIELSLSTKECPIITNHCESIKIIKIN